jgi:hypothetical protein
MNKDQTPIRTEQEYLEEVGVVEGKQFHEFHAVVEEPAPSEVVEEMHVIDESIVTPDPGR